LKHTFNITITVIYSLNKALTNALRNILERLELWKKKQGKLSDTFVTKNATARQKRYNTLGLLHESYDERCRT